MAVYPAALSSLKTTFAGTDQVSTEDHAGVHNAVADEINAIEAELGVDAAGPYATTVRNRFEILDWKRSCRVASTANIAGTYAAGPPATKAVGGTSLSIDGVTLANGDRVFLHDQTTALENGIYQVSGVGTAVVLTRTYDADDGTKLSDSMYVSVEQGATHGDTTWELTTDNPITVGTTALRYTRVTPAYQTGVVGSINNNQGPFNPTGALLENLPRTSIVFANIAAMLASGTIKVFPMGVLKAGQTFTNINFMTGTTASSGTTNTWAGIARVSDRVVLARSNNSTVVWSPASAIRTIPFSAAYTPDSDVAVFGFLMVTATTTVPSLYGITQGHVNFYNTPAIVGTSNTGQSSTPIAVGAALNALSAATTMPYAFLS